MGCRGPSGATASVVSSACHTQTPASLSFAVSAVAEFGDLTQIVIASLAARYHDPLAVGLGAMIGLLLVAALAIVGGQGLLRIVPMAVVKSQRDEANPAPGEVQGMKSAGLL